MTDIVPSKPDRTLLYQVNATVSWTDSEGWHHSLPLPIFCLNADIQGITGEAHARGIASSMLADLVAAGNGGEEPPGYTYHVTVVGITVGK